MAVKVILEGRLAETVRNGEVMAATLDEGATVGNGVHVRITSVDKHRDHPALKYLAGQRVRVTVEAISDDGDLDGDDLVEGARTAEAQMTNPATTPPGAAQSALPSLSGDGQRWADLVDKVARRRGLKASTV